MKRNSIMEACRQLITPEIKRSVDYSIFVANRIFDILERQGKSQRDLAKVLGKSEAEISKWLQGTHTFTTKTIAKIDVALGESIFDISDKTPKSYDMVIHLSANASTKLSTKANRSTTTSLYDGWNEMPITVNEKCCENYK